LAQPVYHFATKPLLEHYTGLEVACYAMWAGTLFLLPLAPAAVVVWGYAVARLTVTAATAALYLVPPLA
jgi:hypothetical protein